MSFVPKQRRLVGCLFRKINRLAIAFRMYQTLQSPSSDRSTTRLMVWVGLFASFTYLVLSAWAQIVFGDRYLWMSDVRLVSIAGGTLLYAHALRSAMRSRTSGGGLARLALHVVGASLIMLTLRYVANRTLSDTPLTIGEHVMWVLVWAGSFGLWVSAFLEMEWRKTSTAPVIWTPVAAAGEVASARMPVRSHRLDDSEAEAWSWIIDALADEMSRHAPEARAELLSHLQRRAGYELADDLNGTAMAHNRRVALVERLARTGERSSRSPH